MYWNSDWRYNTIFAIHWIELFVLFVVLFISLRSRWVYRDRNDVFMRFALPASIIVYIAYVALTIGTYGHTLAHSYESPGTYTANSVMYALLELLLVFLIPRVIAQELSKVGAFSTLKIIKPFAIASWALFFCLEIASLGVIGYLRTHPAVSSRPLHRHLQEVYSELLFSMDILYIVYVAILFAITWKFIVHQAGQANTIKLLVVLLAFLVNYIVSAAYQGWLFSINNRDEYQGESWELAYYIFNIIAITTIFVTLTVMGLRNRSNDHKARQSRLEQQHEDIELT